MAVLSHVGLRSVGVVSSIVHTNVTLNVTLEYPANVTNVTLGLQRSDGNVTLPGQNPVGVTEEAPQAM
jgi:hypothetical protein